MGIAEEAIKPRLIRIILNILSQRSKKDFLIRKPIMG
jgi:hypothetical protein